MKESDRNLGSEAHREEALFQAATQLSGAERVAFLNDACQGDAALRQRLQELLAAHEQSDSLLATEPGAHPPTIKLELTEGHGEAAGQMIGRYKLLQPIGEGGCGVVYMAEQQEPVRRRVALKVIKLGMDTKQVIARFEAERQALALMDHPNIAKVLDAGSTEAGRPYFVMELVKGIPITRYCDENNLSTAKRLGLFVQVCQAIQHAHQKGIIHRDIKPSNVLVADHDGTPVPKIIDFGIAKATTDQRLTDKTLFTAFEQFIGTPAYMSPEQAKLSGLDIDTRSDIYSLGVLLYELLTGKTPFENKRLLDVGLDEIRRIIREEEPVRPSTRLHTLDAAEQTTVAKHRQSDPPKLAHLISGDLDWIVMKTLEKDRARRYETANGLAMDIQRHLNNEPILARPPGRLYRFQKLVRRNKLAFAATCAVAMALLAGLGLSTWAFQRERQAHASERRLLYVADLNLAQPAWDQNNIGQINQLLEETQAFPDRGFEWYYWQRQAHLCLQTFRGNGVPNPVYVAISPDGQRIVTGHANRTAKVWERASGRELLTLNGHSDMISSVAFSPDGKRILTGSWDTTAKVWDAASGQELLTLKGHNGWILSVAFAPDGRRIATSSQDSTAKIWDAANGRALISIKGPVSRAVAFSPNSQRLITGGDDYLARVWEVTNGQELLALHGHTLHISSAAFSPDGGRIVTGSWDHTAKVWDAASGQELSTLHGHDDRVNSVTFSPDGRRIVSGSSDHTARVWDTASGRGLFTIKGNGGAVESVAFSSDGQWIVTGSWDGTAKLWDAASDQEPLSVKGDIYQINSVAFSPDGQRFITGGTGQAKVWETATGRDLLTLHGHGTTISSVAFSPDGQRIVTAAWDNTAKVWDGASGRELLTLDLKGTNLQVRSVAFSPDSQRIVTGCGDVTAKLWDASNGRELLKFSGEVYCVAFSPDGRHIVTGGWDSKARLCDAASGRELLTFPPFPSATELLWESASGRGLLTPRGHRGWVVCAAFSPDSQRIATGSLDNTAKVWDASNGRELLTLKGHNDAVSSVAFSPDGRRVVTASADHTAKIWDAATGRELLTLRGHSNSISSVAFSPDGQRIVTGGLDGTAKVWEAARKEQVARWEAEEAASVRH